MRRSDILVSGTWALALALLAHAAVADSYTVVEMATLQQSHTPVVRGANSAGVAVGGGKVMDTAAFALARESRLSILVGSLHPPSSIATILSGEAPSTLVAP